MTGLRTRRSVICSCQKKGWERIENNHWAFGIPLQGYLFELIKHNVIQFMGIIEIQEELFRSKDERWETLRFCCGIFPQQILFWSAQKHRWFHQQKLREARSMATTCEGSAEICSNVCRNKSEIRTSGKPSSPGFSAGSLSFPSL